MTAVRDDAGHALRLPGLECQLGGILAAIRAHQAGRPPGRSLEMNRILLYAWPELNLTHDEIQHIARGLAPVTHGLGIDEIIVRVRLAGKGMEKRSDADSAAETMLRFSNPTGTGFVVQFLEPSDDPLPPLTDYELRVAQLRRRGLVHPYELVRMMTEPAGEFGLGTFVEHDLDDEDQLVAVNRPYGNNPSSVVVGLITNVTDTYPEGMSRVVLLGDPSKGLGSLAEPECRRIIAGLDLAERQKLPVDWFALSAGAKIAMDGGTENMDWIARVLRRIVLFTQAGGEINVVVAGINVGAQPYWNAEATMLMHTKGILVMTPDSAMVLTGKQALDYSGGVSAEDNQGIGGYERVMGPNGQAQYWAPDLAAACQILLRHYD